MVKNFLTKPILLLTLTLVTLGLSGCKKDDPIILFNRAPITKETILNNSREFRSDDRIYYIFITQKPLKTPYIRVQIYKKDEKVEFWGTKVVYSNDYKLSKDQIYYYDDYVVLRETGHYFMLIFSKDNLGKPVAFSDFFVR